MIKQSLKFSWYTLACIAVCFALMMTAMRIITPQLAAKKVYFQQVASQVLQRPVQIGEIEGEMQGFSPVLVFHNVALLEKDHSHVLLKVKQVSVSISLFQSLFHWQIRPGTITIDGAHVIVKHRPDGQLTIAGIDTLPQSDSANSNELLEWLLHQQGLALRHVQIHWITKTNRVLHLTDVSVTLDNYHQHHQFRGQFRLQQPNMSTFQIIGDLKGQANQMANWGGSIYLATDHLVLQQWLAEIPWTIANVQSGIVSGRFWLNLDKSKIQRVHSEFAASKLALQVKAKENLVPILIDSTSGILDWAQNATGWSLQASDLQMQYNKQRWPSNTIKVDVKNNQVTTSIHYVYLDALQSLLQQWQLPKMQGVLKDLVIGFPSDNNPGFIKGSAVNFGMAAYQEVPAFTGFDGDFNLSQQAGDIKLNTQKLLIGQSKWLAKPLQLATVIGQVHYQKQENQFQVTGRSFYIQQNPLIALRGGFDWRTSNEYPSGMLNLIAGFSLQQGHDILSYLPSNQSDLAHWLTQSITQQGLISGKLIVQGDVAQFPFKQNNGIFDLTLNVRDTGLHFHPDWPLMTHADGALHIHNQDLSADIQRAQLGTVWFQQAHVQIPDITALSKVLLLQAKTHTQLKDALQTLQGSPVENAVAPLVGLQATGPFQLNLDLQIPLQKNGVPVINGDVNLENTTLHIPKADLAVQRVTGKVKFTRDYLHAEDLNGWWDGMPLHGNVVTSPDHLATNVTVDSKINAKKLSQWLPNSIADQITGSTGFHLAVAVPHEKKAPIQLNVQSNLVGIESKLPGPLAKTSQEISQLNANATLTADAQPFTAKIQNGKRGQLQFALNGKNWKVNVDSPEIKGQLELDGQQKNHLQGHMQRFYYHSSENKSNTASTTQTDPNAFPSVNVSVDDFRFDDKKMGKLTLKASRMPNGLNLDELSLHSDPFELTAHGSWQLQNLQTISKIHGEAMSSDLSAMLAMWNIPPAVEAERGYYRFNFTSAKPLYEMGIKDLTGQLHIQLNQGRITKLSPDTEKKLGIGKLLSVLSLQSLPNHILQGFSDVSKTGFPYTIFSGDFNFAHGQATTDNAEIDGLVAYAKLTGTIGFNDKDYNVKVRVSPHLESTLPLVATVAGGPVAGAATWVATHVMSHGIRAVNHYDYVMQGKWDDPVVKVG